MKQLGQLFLNPDDGSRVAVSGFLDGALKVRYIDLPEGAPIPEVGISEERLDEDYVDMRRTVKL